MFAITDTTETKFWVKPENSNPEISEFGQVSYFYQVAQVREPVVNLPFDKKNSENKDLHFGLLSGILFLLVWMLYRFKGAYRKIISNMTETPANRETFESDVSSEGWTGLILSAIALLSWSFFLTVMNEYVFLWLEEENILNTLEIFAFTLVILCSIVLIYSLISLIIKWVLRLADTVELLSKFNRYFFQSATVIILPMSVILSLSVFSGSLLLFYSGLFMLSLLFGFRMLRMFYLTLSKNNLDGVLYIILYFCALEIIPFLIVGKIAISRII